MRRECEKEETEGKEYGRKVSRQRNTEDLSGNIRKYGSEGTEEK